MFWLLLFMLISDPTRVAAYGPTGEPVEFPTAEACAKQLAVSAPKLKAEIGEPFALKCVAMKPDTEVTPKLLKPSGEVW